MHAEADDGQHGGDEQRIDLKAEEASEDGGGAKHDKHVVTEGDDGRRAVAHGAGHGEERHRHIEQDGNGGRDDCKRRVA